MKYFAAILAFLIWCLCTLFLSMTVIGILMTLVYEEYWEIPSSIFQVFEN